MSEPIQLPGRECRCVGDGTFADWSRCPVHTEETSPAAQAVRRNFEEGMLAGAREWIRRLEERIERLCNAGADLAERVEEIDGRLANTSLDAWTTAVAEARGEEASGG